MVGVREEKKNKVTQLLLEHLVNPHRERIKKTGSLLPTKSLRHRETREALLWAKDIDMGDGRYFTQALVRDCLKDLVQYHGVEVPESPGFVLQSWIDNESSLLHKLLKRARKSTSSSPGSVSAMAEEDTQAWSCMDYNLDPTQDRFAI